MNLTWIPVLFPKFNQRSVTINEIKSRHRIDGILRTTTLLIQLNTVTNNINVMILRAIDRSIQSQWQCQWIFTTIYEFWDVTSHYWIEKSWILTRRFFCSNMSGRPRPTAAGQSLRIVEHRNYHFIFGIFIFVGALIFNLHLFFNSNQCNVSVFSNDEVMHNVQCSTIGSHPMYHRNN